VIIIKEARENRKVTPQPRVTPVIVGYENCPYGMNGSVWAFIKEVSLQGRQKTGQRGAKKSKLGPDPRIKNLLAFYCFVIIIKEARENREVAPQPRVTPVFI
jgi:hypothetical protein